MKKNYRITFYDGPEGNRSKTVDVLLSDAGARSKETTGDSKEFEQVLE